MGLLAELKRRNVIRVAGLYIILSWLLMQVSDIVLPLFGVPDWGMRLILFLLAVGFVLTLVFSWVYEMTPEGLKKDHEVDHSESITDHTGGKINTLILVALVVAIGLMVYQQFGPASEARPVPDARAGFELTPAEQKQIIPSIAVLPFADMSPGHDQEYFSDGISEELLNLLAKVEQFKVAGRTSSFAFKGKEDDLRVIGAKLNVGAILDGSVRKSGDRIRITAQLVNVHDGFQLWSETYDRTLEDVFAVQDEIANEVVSALKMTLLGDDSGSSIVTEKVANPVAYQFYLKGRFQMHKRSPDALALAEKYFQQAIAEDANYALAYSGLSDTLQLQVSYAGLDRREAKTRSETAIAKALELDTGSADIWASVGLIKTSIRDRQDMREGREALEKAIEINPNHAMAHMWLATAIVTPDPAKALTLNQKAYEIDPLHPTILANLVNRLGSFGRIDEAFALAEEFDALYPELGRGATLRGRLHYNAGRLDKALIAYQFAYRLAPERVSNFQQIPRLLSTLGELDLAESWSQEVERYDKRFYGGLFRRAQIARQQQRMEQYLAMFEEYAERNPSRQADNFLGVAYLRARDFERARTALERSLLKPGQERIIVNSDNYGDVGPYAAALVRLGQTDRAHELAESVLAIYEERRAKGLVYQRPGEPIDVVLARLKLVLGRNSEAMQSLTHAFELGYRRYEILEQEQIFDRLRDDLGFAALVRAMKTDIEKQRQGLADSGRLLTPEQLRAAKF